ncbi:MAG: hypothetical protein U0787_14080 [Polyangia bacterium]
MAVSTGAKRLLGRLAVGPQRQASTGERFGKMAYLVGKDRRSHSER